jgi:hypothetical protein
MSSPLTPIQKVVLEHYPKAILIPDPIVLGIPESVWSWVDRIEEATPLSAPFLGMDDGDTSGTVCVELQGCFKTVLVRNGEVLALLEE